MAIADSQFETARVYHDFNSLAQLKSKGRNDSPEAIREAAKQFESVFTRMMLKSMRDANAAIIDEPLFDSNQLDMYKDMYDEQLSLHLSSSGSGLGLTDVLVQQLSPNAVQSTASKKSESTFNPTIVPKAAPSLSVLSSQSINVEEKNNIAANSMNKEQYTAQNQPANKNDSAAEVLAKPINEAKSIDERAPDFSTPVAFVQSLWQHAKQAAKELQTDPKVLIAQAALETGWGQHIMQTEQGGSSKNLFGIKANHNWQGEKVQVSTLEFNGESLQKKRAEFRSYNSYADSFADYTAFIKGRGRYDKALNVSSKPEAYIQELQTAGYASDPEYADKVNNIMHSSRLNNAINTISDSAE